MNIHERRLLLVLNCAQMARMFPDLREYETRKAREYMAMPPRDLYIFWQMLEECDLLPDAECYVALEKIRKNRAECADRSCSAT